MEAKRMGNVGVQTKKGLEMIREVLLVLDVNQNLLSVGQLVKHDYAVHLRDNCCTIYDKDDWR